MGIEADGHDEFNQSDGEFNLDHNGKRECLLRLMWFSADKEDFGIKFKKICLPNI